MSATSTLEYSEKMKGVDEAQLKRLEKESERFATEIKTKEVENASLRDEITKIQSQLKASQDQLSEITKVRLHDACISE